MIVPAFPRTLLLSQWIATKTVPGKTRTNHIPGLVIGSMFERAGIKQLDLVRRNPQLLLTSDKISTCSQMLLTLLCLYGIVLQARKAGYSVGLPARNQNSLTLQSIPVTAK